MNKMIGIDIQKNVLRYAILKKTNPIIIEDFGEYICESNLFKISSKKNRNRLNQHFKEFVKHFHLKNKKVIYSTLSQNLLIKPVLINEVNKFSKIKNHIFLELGESINVPFEEPIFDILSVKEKHGNNKKISKDKSKNVAEDLLVNLAITNETNLIYMGDVIEINGNIPYAVDISPLAFHRLIIKSKKFSNYNNKNYLLVELGCGEAAMTIICNGEPRFHQYEEYNPDHWSIKTTAFSEMTDEREWELACFFEDSVEKSRLLNLIETINNFIYLFVNELCKGENLEDVLIVGDNPILKNEMKDFFRKYIKCHVDFFKMKISNESGIDVPQRYYKALGLALKEEDLS